MSGLTYQGNNIILENWLDFNLIFIREFQYNRVGWILSDPLLFTPKALRHMGGFSTLFFRSDGDSPLPGMNL